MPKFVCNKLGRDKIVEVCEEQEVGLDCRLLSNEEFKKELINKLVEEVNEVVDAKNDTELIEELGDVQEVLNCILSAYNFEAQKMESIQKEKRGRKGSYTKGIFIKSFTVDEDTKYGQYFLSQPEKYKVEK